MTRACLLLGSIPMVPVRPAVSVRARDGELRAALDHVAAGHAWPRGTRGEGGGGARIVITRHISTRVPWNRGQLPKELVLTPGP